MTRIRSLFAMIGLATGGLMGCEVCSSDPLNASEQVELGIDTDLHDLVDLHIWVTDERRYEFLAVGASGTVVIWGNDFAGRGHETIVEVFDLGDRDLRAAWLDGSGAWWVVGDAATLMVSNNRGATWDAVDLQTDADLYGIAGFNDRPIVVGDDVIAMRNVDGTWTELPPPAGGWGQLRGISANYLRIVVVGLGGVIWSTTDPSGTWTLEPSGVSADLFAVSSYSAVGAEGTLLRYDEMTGWVRADTGVEVDLVDVEGHYVLGANGEIYETSQPLALIDTDPGARGLSSNFDGWATVGDGGSASSPPPHNCL